MSGLSIAKSLELSLLGPNVTCADVASGCELAAAHHLAATCVYPVHVRHAVGVLAGADTRVCAAIGFPLGHETIDTRLHAIEQALADGAHEVAVMLNHSAIVGGEIDEVCREVDRICAATFRESLTSTRGRGHLTLVVESTLYDCESLAPLWARMHDTSVGFLQTASGYLPRAVTEDHVQALRELLPADVAIKAVGAVGTLDDALGLLAAGAVRIGSGSAVVIAQQEREARQVRRSG